MDLAKDIPGANSRLRRSEEKVRGGNDNRVLFRSLVFFLAFLGKLGTRTFSRFAVPGNCCDEETGAGIICIGAFKSRGHKKETTADEI